MIRDAKVKLVEDLIKRAFDSWPEPDEIRPATEIEWADLGRPEEIDTDPTGVIVVPHNNDADDDCA